jgi:hypothetical protein
MRLGRASRSRDLDVLVHVEFRGRAIFGLGGVGDDAGNGFTHLSSLAGCERIPDDDTQG